MRRASRWTTWKPPASARSVAWPAVSRALAVLAGLLCTGGCIGKSLASSPCGLVTSATEAQPGELSVAGSFTVTGTTQLVMVLTTAPYTTRQYPATAMTGTTALIPLTSLPLIPHGTYAATWIMQGCETPDQTHLIGPDSVTVSG
jgi:hypothetical protein